MVFTARLAFASFGYFHLNETSLSGRGQEEKYQPPLIWWRAEKVVGVWWFILSNVLGYKNVEIDVGSTEDWMEDDSAPIEPYTKKPDMVFLSGFFILKYLLPDYDLVRQINPITKFTKDIHSQQPVKIDCTSFMWNKCNITIFNDMRSDL